MINEKSLKWHRLIERGRVYSSRTWDTAPGNLQIPDSNAPVFHHLIRNDKVENPERIKRILSIAKRARTELAKVGEIPPRERTLYRESVISAYVENIEAEKKKAVTTLVRRLDDRRKSHESGEFYRGDSEAVGYDTLRLEKAKLRAATMSDNDITAAIGKAANRGEYDEIELLSLAGRADKKQAESIGKILQSDPPWLANKHAKADLEALGSIMSVGVGNVMYQIKGAEGSTSQTAMAFLNDPPETPTETEAIRQARESAVKKALASED